MRSMSMFVKATTVRTMIGVVLDRARKFSGRFQYQVFERVYDGDTVLLSNGSKVRLLSSNTPEIESPHRSGEPGGEEARLWLKDAVEGKKVYLEEDV